MKEKIAIILESKVLKGPLVVRVNKILSLCSGHKVLHLGCADYPYSVRQYENGNLFHEKLCRISAHVTGIDLSEEGIKFLKSKEYQNLYVGNVEDSATLLPRGKFDVVVAGEMLEHLSNVGKFFENISVVMHKESLLIVTVPNAHAMKSFIRVLLGKELVHPDHVYYFSPATMEHLCRRYGYEMIEYSYYLSEPGSIVKRAVFSPIKIILRYFFPYVSDGIIFVIRKSI